MTPDEGAQKGMASSLTVGGVAVTNGLRHARLTMFAQQLSLADQNAALVRHNINLQNSLLPNDD